MKNQTRRILTALVILPAILLAACGGSTPPPAQEPPPASPQAERSQRAEPPQDENSLTEPPPPADLARSAAFAGLRNLARPSPPEEEPPPPPQQEEAEIPPPTPTPEPPQTPAPDLPTEPQGERPFQVVQEDPPPNGMVDSLAADVVRLVNAERERVGLPPLRTNPALTQAAQTRAQELVLQASHNRPDGRGWSTVLDGLGLRLKAWGENIAWGQRSPEEVMGDWMGSPGHRENILREDFTQIGVGVYRSGGSLYWVQLFGG